MNLELIPTEELAKELLSRCDHGALILMRCGEAGNKDSTYTRRWHGNTHACMGLCHDLHDTILRSFRQVEKAWDGEGT